MQWNIPFFILIFHICKKIHTQKKEKKKGLSIAYNNMLNLFFKIKKKLEPRKETQHPIPVTGFSGFSVTGFRATGVR
jgi:hypothetical protein